MKDATDQFDFTAFAGGERARTLRMQERARRIIKANLDAIVDARVLDLAATDGRWTYAALAAGASRVTAIEERRELAAEARSHLASLGLAGRYLVRHGDVFDLLHSPRDLAESPDTILCVSIYHQITDHARLMRLMARQVPRTILIDSVFLRSFRSQVLVGFQDDEYRPAALAGIDGQRDHPAGMISLGLMLRFAWRAGYRCVPVLWDGDEISHRNPVQDYLSGRRFTLRLDRMQGYWDRDWQPPWRDALVRLNPRLEALFDPERHDSATDALTRDALHDAPFAVPFAGLGEDG